jgi:putative membrane protein
MQSEGERERHLAASSLVPLILGRTRNLLLPAALVWFYARDDRWEAWLALLFVPFVLGDVVRWITLRWSLGADELVVRKGIFFRSVRHVPFARIQNIDLKQTLVHRLLRIAAVRVETAGGLEPEAELDAISLDAYEELRSRVFAGRERAAASEASAAPPASRTLLALSLGDLFILSLRPVRAAAILAAALGLSHEYGLFDRADVAQGFEAWIEATPAAVHALILAAGGIVLVFGLSLAATVVALYGYRLDESDGIFRIRRGLFTHEMQTLPRGRIQLVEVRRTLFDRAFGRVRVRVGTAGGEVGGSEGNRARGAHFAPLVRWEALPAILSAIRPGLDLDALAWESLDQRAGRRKVVRALLGFLPLAAALVYLQPLWGAVVALPVGAVLVWGALRGARRAGFALADGVVAWRQGAFTTTTSVTFDDKIQNAVLQESPFDRRHRHALLAVDTAGGLMRTLERVPAPSRRRGGAAAGRDARVARAARARFRW